MVHRSYLDHGTIQVAVYDNRWEITSPGKLPMEQTMERMKEGYSKIRNEALALRINIYRGQGETKDHNDFINANKVPDTTEKVPNSADGVPDTVEKVSDSAGKMPHGYRQNNARLVWLMCPYLSANYVADCSPDMAQVSAYKDERTGKRQKLLFAEMV